MKKTKLRIIFCETNVFRIYKLTSSNYLKGWRAILSYKNKINKN